MFSMLPMGTSPVLNFMVAMLVMKSAFRYRYSPEYRAAAVAAARSLNVVEEGAGDEPPPEGFRVIDRESMDELGRNFGPYREMVEILCFIGEQFPPLGIELMHFFLEAVPEEIRRLTADELAMLHEAAPPQSGGNDQERASAAAGHVAIDIPDPAPETEPPSSVIIGSGTEPRPAAQVGGRIRREIEMTIPPFNPLPLMPTSRTVPPSPYYFTGESSAAGSRRAAKETDEAGAGKSKEA
ncbi:unnamed protein product [Linum trigynum]